MSDIVGDIQKLMNEFRAAEAKYPAALVVSTDIEEMLLEYLPWAEKRQRIVQLMGMSVMVNDALPPGTAIAIDRKPEEPDDEQA